MMIWIINIYLNDNYYIKKLNNYFSSLSLKSIMLIERIDMKLKIRKNKLILYYLINYLIKIIKEINATLLSIFIFIIY